MTSDNSHILLRGMSNPATASSTYDGPILVGKDILELLSSSMYVNPLTIYREYVQNAVDSIDEAIELGELPNASAGRIDIVLDHIQRRSVVRDNGIGLNEDEFVQRMTSFGASRKRGTSARGFRGVGRLAGLGYCQELVFRTRAKGAKRVLEVKWDCKSLKRLLLAEDFEGNLEDLVKQTVSVKWADTDDHPERFFEVEIIRPRRIRGDSLLNELEIGTYLAQVGPCPFNPRFSFSDEIREILSPIGAPSSEYQIYLNESTSPIYRPYLDKILFSETRVSRPRGIEEISISGIDGNLAATGWILHHDYQGAIPTHLGIKGLRARVGNIQVGNDRIFSGVFPEERFCSWTVGEVHLTDKKILPNGRRDDFEPNNQIANVINHLSPYGFEIARRCRRSSQIRNRRKIFEFTEQKLMNKFEIVEQGAISKAAERILRQEISGLLSDIRDTSNFDLFEKGEISKMDARVAELEKLSVGTQDVSNSSDPLHAVPKNRKTAYREIFDLIYQCAPNQVVAKSLVDRILNRISEN